MTDQVNEAVATLSERRQWVRHAAETYARANDDAKVRVLRKEEAALGLAIQSLQNPHPSRGVVDEVIATLDEIGGLTRALRHGGPAPEDLQGLSDALTEATSMAHEAMHALQATQPVVPSVPEWTAVLDALDAVNEAANDARHRGEYGKANKLVNARVTLYRAALANEEAATPKDQPAQGVG